MPVPVESEPKNKPKQEPTIRAIKQINKIITTATQPPAAMAAINPFTAAMVALTAAIVTRTAALTPAIVAFAVALAACAAFCAAFAVACAVLAACCAVFAERWAVLIPLALFFTPFIERLAVFTAF